MRIEFAGILLAWAAGPAWAQSFTYSTFTFDASGATATFPSGINNSSQIVGVFDDAAGRHAFLRTGADYRIIEAPGATTTFAAGINNLGQVVGIYRVGTVSHGYLRSADGQTFTTFDAPDLGPAVTNPTAVNDNGEIVGTGFSAGSITDGFLRSSDGLHYTTIEFGTHTEPWGIMNDGTVSGTGWTPTAAELPRGFLRSAAGKYARVDVPGIEGTRVAGINNAGQFVGTFDIHGFVRNADGSFTTLDIPGAQATLPMAINDRGEVVGSYRSADGVSHGFLAEPSVSVQPLIRTVKGVMSAFQYGAFDALAPGTWIEIYGTNLASGTREWSTADFSGDTAPLSLDGVSVTIGGRPAPISYISPGQVNVQVPSDTPPGNANVTVTKDSRVAIPYSIPVNSVEPGLLSIPNFHIAAISPRYVVALFPDFVTYVQASGLDASLPSRPAKAQDVVILFGIGFGPVSPEIPAGRIARQLTSLPSFEVQINGVSAKVGYAGLLPGSVGLYQFNVEVPAGVLRPGQAAGPVPLTFSVNGVPGAQPLLIGIEP
jgi:uncharacterized protein (TIGR03437 family)